MESRKAHILENGGSNPSPAINPLRVKLFVYRRSMSQVDLRYSERVEIQPGQCLAVKGGEYGALL